MMHETLASAVRANLALVRWPHVAAVAALGFVLAIIVRA